MNSVLIILAVFIGLIIIAAIIGMLFSKDLLATFICIPVAVVQIVMVFYPFYPNPFAALVAIILLWGIWRSAIFDHKMKQIEGQNDQS